MTSPSLALTSSLALLAVFTCPVLGKNIDLIADYSAEGANEGFNDPSLGAARRAAFSQALTIWEGYLQESYAGQEITIRAVFDPLGGEPDTALLGRASANGGSIIEGNTFAGNPLASNLLGFDTNGATHDINITFNSDIDNSFVLGSQDYYYGIDANPGSDIDFISVALHEIGHGLDFSSDIRTGGLLRNPTLSRVYDQFLVDAAVEGTLLSTMTDAERLVAVTSDNLFWLGENAVAANGGNRVQIHAPETFLSGSSVSHVDEGVHGELTLSPLYDDDIINHELSAIELGIFQDLGWSITAVPEPSSLSLLAVSALSLSLRRRR